MPDVVQLRGWRLESVHSHPGYYMDFGAFLSEPSASTSSGLRLSSRMRWAAAVDPAPGTRHPSQDPLPALGGHRDASESRRRASPDPLREQPKPLFMMNRL